MIQCQTSKVTRLLSFLAVLVIQGLINITWRLHDVHDCVVMKQHQGGVYPLQTFKQQQQQQARFASPFDKSLSLGGPTTTNFGGVIARPFDAWPATSSASSSKSSLLPCVEAERNWPQTTVQRSPSHDGFLYVREMKTGSSSAVGVNLRIARNVARRYHHHDNFKMCKHRNDHAIASKLDYGNRNKSNSFLWTIIRDPTKRAVSCFICGALYLWFGFVVFCYGLGDSSALLGNCVLLCGPIAHRCSFSCHSLSSYPLITCARY